MADSDQNEQRSAGRRRRRGGDPPRDPQREPSREPRGGRGGPSLEERAARVHRDLRAIVGEIAAHLDIPLGSADRPRDLELRLELALDGDAAAAPVLDAVTERLRDLRDADDAVVPGRVFCFQCRSAACDHAAPPDARAVFLAYSATGKPVWREFTEACLAWSEPRVDLLYGDPPAVIAVQRSAAELTGELIAGFGRDERAYRLLGQVACGYLPFASANGRERGALTLQVVGARRGTGPLALHLNPVGLRDDIEGRRGRPGWWEQRALSDSIRDARQQLQALALRLRRRRGGIRRELEEGVGATLARLRGALERRHRPQQHRTRHARDRQFEGGRPTHAAVSDAERAPDDRLLYEPDRDTMIVLGPKGRVHVFAEDGRHVTSLHHRRDAIERRLDRKQWVPCEGARRDRFRAAIARLGHRDA